MTESFEVVIVGAGPAGLVLANLLGAADIQVALVEQNAEVVEEPRAVGIDDEALRTLQTFGMAEPVLQDAVRNAPIRYYDSRGRVLAHVAPTQAPQGWPRRNLFFQPDLERKLRAGLGRWKSVTFLPGHEVVQLDPGEKSVRLVTRHADGERVLTGGYAVGADGGRSFLRRILDIPMLGDTAPMTWLVVDVADDTWDAPYSAVFTSPKRPSMTIPLPFGYRRFEFKILDGEDPAEMTEPSRVAELIAPFYPAGELPRPIRRRVYWHHSRTAARFREGRVFLAGDAAHLQPPFFGQGMNSGIRDVTNLAWKLAMVVRGHAADSLLDTYDQERREVAKTMVEFATGIGRLYQPRSRVTEVLRNTAFRGAQRIPGARDYILQMKYKPIPHYQEGFVRAARQGKNSLVGKAFPQPRVQTTDGRSELLDEVLGHRLALLSLVPGAHSRLSPAKARAWAELGAAVVEVHAPPSYRRQGQEDPRERPAGPDIEALAIFDSHGGLRDLLLARPQDQVYVVRPDRYVAATGSLDDVDKLVTEVLKLLE
ncbi:bifunctional 3-(3-hydroxy-phenyl)propionate/3-hydroxycinnamic acid hydroxylase [Streptomyces sp. NPDC090075]|uniref:bifunctional 3-(3-hydroxy-phenyl)propionate/3-hydroxycinnamic acid hydroxylase n=1 Tax=Streptomyces sp. NPDC090075 TaxID=3365937 RepID=UPI00381D9800